MNAFFAGLQSLIITVRRNALSSAFTTFMLLILIFAWSARDNIATFIERNPSSHQEKQRFDQSVVADSQINATLEDVRKQLNADRILIRQFHNSKADLTGLPFASVSTTYYSLSPGVDLTMESLQSYPLSTVNEQLSRMFQPEQAPQCSIVRPIKDISDPSYRNYLEKNGEVLVYACPLMNLRGQPVGFITVSYLTEEKERPSDEEINIVINRTGERVVGYLTRVIEPERKPWYETIFSKGNK